jgi:hypothetical protein
MPDNMVSVDQQQHASHIAQEYGSMRSVVSCVTVHQKLPSCIAEVGSQSSQLDYWLSIVCALTVLIAGPWL